MVQDIIVEVPPKVHNLQRKQNLAFGRITDNAGSVTASVIENFDMSKTIFKTLPRRGIKALFQQSKIDVEYDFDAAVAQEIEAAFAKVQRPVSDEAPIYNFMMKECDFTCEHADGSFFDHIYFCYDYTATHYKTGYPRVLLLHSILGVGTNCFPMELKKLPMLESLVPAKEMRLVEAFPSVLRLLIHGPLLRELMATDTPKLATLQSLRMHRVIDNAPFEISAAQLWQTLNYQLIHAIDFLPPAAWQRNQNYFFDIFVSLHELLSRTGHLECTLDWQPEWMKPYAPGACVNDWRHFLFDLVPSALVRKLASKGIATYSAEIGHSLEYTITWRGAVAPAPS